MEAPAIAQLERSSRAHWWAGDIPACIETDEQLYERYLDDGRPADAADRALRLGLEWGTRGDLTLAYAWLNRAKRLLLDVPPCPVHGYVIYCDAAMDLDVGGEPAAAIEASAELEGLASEHGDATLQCFALVLAGSAAIRAGDLRGFDVLDEALLPIVGGQVDAMWAGDAYCTVIHLCEGLGDLARMRSWTDALARWAAPLSETFMYAGVTRIHQLQLLLAEGQWDVVVDELEKRSSDLENAHGWLAGAGYYELGEVRRLRDECDAARLAYEKARSLGVEPQPGEALLLHAEGRRTEALAALRIALAGGGSLARARLIVPTVEIALEVGEPDYAGELADELQATADLYGTPGLLALAARARAATLVADEQSGVAIPLLQHAGRIYREQRFQHAGAQVREALARAYRRLGSPERAHAEEATARAIFERLGAAADLRRMTSSARPGELTGREVEVLTKVAAGLTNKQVAESLVISDKTVGRHLDNIFTKIGVTSRTAAAAWAHGHGLLR